MKKLEKILFVFMLLIFSCNNVFAKEFKMQYDSACVVERTYTIYQMFYVEDGAYKVSSDWKDFYTTGAGKDRVSFDENDVLINVEGSVYADDFVKDAVEYAKELVGVEKEATCTDDYSTFDIEEDGYYLITSSKGNAAMIIDFPKMDYIVDKNRDPILELEIIEGLDCFTSYDVNIDDELSFVYSAVADGSQTEHIVEFVVPEGLTIDPTKMVVDMLNPEDYEIIYDGLENENASFGIKITDEYLASLYSNNQNMKYTFSFTGKINENINVSTEGSSKANVFKAILYYGDSNMEKSINLRTWGYSLITGYYDTDSNLVGVPNVHYSISKDSKGEEVLNFVKISDGTYRLAKSDDTNKVTDLVNNSGSNIVLLGLDSGTYYVSQDTVPYGYKASDSSTIVLEVDDENEINLENYSKVFLVIPQYVMLPTTGGAGTTLIITIGLLMFVLSLSAIITKMRKAKN